MAVAGVVRLVEERGGDVAEVRDERAVERGDQALGHEGRDVVLARQHRVHAAVGDEAGEVGPAAVHHQLDARAAGLREVGRVGGVEAPGRHGRPHRADQPRRRRRLDGRGGGGAAVAAQAARRQKPRSGGCQELAARDR